MIKKIIRNWLDIEERSMELNKDNEELMRFLGIEPGEVNVKGKNALKVDTVFACVRIRSEAVAKLPVKIYQEDESGVKKAARHQLYSLLKLRPNPYMSAFDFAKCMEAQSCLYGNAYASIEYDRKGRVVGLWPIDATKVKVMVDDIGLLDGVIGRNTKLWYEVRVGAEKRKIMPDEILHLKGGITLDGLIGISPIEYLKSTIENGAAASRFINNFYKQGLQVKGLIQYVGDIDPKARRTFRNEFEEMAAGLKNSHRVAIMPIGYQFTPMSLTMHDAQFLQNTELSIRQIATAFGIKMHQINDLSRATHTNVAEQQREFYSDTLQPILTMYEQEMTYKLLLDSEITAGYFVRYNVDAILRADIKTRYEAYRIGIQSGFLKANEARGKEELPPEEGGDQLLVNGNMQPITMAGSAYTRKGGGNLGTKENDEGNQSNSNEN